MRVAEFVIYFFEKFLLGALRWVTRCGFYLALDVAMQRLYGVQTFSVYLNDDCCVAIKLTKLSFVHLLPFEKSN
jgi:hypothetical protein